MKHTILGFCIIFASCLTAQRPIVIDHDGGIDDVISVTLQLLNSPELIKAITIAPADCYGYPAAWTMQQVQKYFLPASIHIPVGVSSDEGANPFPAVWRDDAWKLSRIPLWNNAESLQNFMFDAIPTACTVLAQALENADIPVNILETGPCTNLAEILRMRPDLKNKINRIVIMGGAVYVSGNVDKAGHDGSAEWNIYNNPQAFYEVLRSGVPITLVSLDATQYTPIRKEFLEQVASNKHIKSFQLVHESLKTIQPFIDSGEYLFWDTLTSAVLINPAIVKTKKVKIAVILNGASMGRTIEDDNGYEVDVAVWADQALFEQTVLSILTKYNGEK